MTSIPEATSDAVTFGRAYIACGYLLGIRGEALGAGLPDPGAFQKLYARLSQEDQNARARALAAELTRVGRLLAQKRVK